MDVKNKYVMNKEEYIFGTRAIIEAIENGRPIDRVLIKKGLQNELYLKLFKSLKVNQIPYQFVPIEKINRITRKNHQGLIALLSPIEFHSIKTLLPEIFEKGKDPFILILDQITDVRNFGAIVRSAECSGVHAIIIPEKGFAQIGADAMKTSAGALNHLPICREKNLSETISFLKNSGIKILAANEKADKLYFKEKMDIPIAIVMGSEEKGISKEILTQIDSQVKIPILGKIESLNVSVASAIIIYEALRQRKTN